MSASGTRSSSARGRGGKAIPLALTCSCDLARPEDHGPQVTRRWPSTVELQQRAGRIDHALLARHKLVVREAQRDAFVFATRSGRPLGQRNVARALRRAQKHATDGWGLPTFPILHQVDASGKPVRVPTGSLPSLHSFRHTVASRALLAGESVNEVAFLLGHRDATVTRTVYVREIADARRRAMRRSRMVAEYAGALRVALETNDASRSSPRRSSPRECM